MGAGLLDTIFLGNHDAFRLAIIFPRKVLVTLGEGIGALPLIAWGRGPSGSRPLFPPRGMGVGPRRGPSPSILRMGACLSGMSLVGNHDAFQLAIIFPHRVLDPLGYELALFL